MMTLITVIHLVVAVLLILFVLVQDSKGDGMGTTFGGGNANSVLGATGTVSFLAKATRVAVIIFAITSIILTRLSSQEKGSVIDSGVQAPSESQAPAATPAAPTANPVAPVEAPATAPTAQ